MSGKTGANELARLGGKDLNNDGQIINLVVVGSSRYYDYSVIEEILVQWIELEGYPDIVIVGGASGVDYLAERWADNNNIPFVVFSDMWENPRPGLEDSGRGEAPTDLTDKLLDAATHILAFESKTSKWTKIVAEMANEIGLPTYVYHLEDSE